MASSRGWASSNYLHFRDGQSRRRTAAIVVMVEFEPVEITTVLAVVPFSKLASENIDIWVNQSHSTAYFGFEEASDVRYLLPGGCFEVYEPEIVKHDFLGRGSPINENMALRQS